MGGQGRTGEVAPALLGAGWCMVQGERCTILHNDALWAKVYPARP